MRGKRIAVRDLTLPAVLAVVSLGIGVGAGKTAWAATKPAGCVRGIIEGEVRAGTGFVRPIGNGLEVLLDPVPSGWILRILPVGVPRPAHDYAELATPPYQSMSPLLFTTDFSFRAQDIVAWNPRNFRFAADGQSFREMSELYQKYLSTRSVAIEGYLVKLVSRAPAGTAQILDAHLVPGTADQAKMAGMVASHFATTAHSVEEPADGKSSPLGRVTWMRFRITLDFPEGFRPANGVLLDQHPCST